MDLFNNFIRKEEENQDIVTADFEINDYPPNAIKKVTSREFIGTIYDLTNCVITIRGTVIEPGKKVAPG